MATILDELERLGYGDVDAAPNDVELSAARSPGFVTRGFLCFYAAFASVGVGAGDVVEGGIVASIGTTLPFPIRLAEFHAAKIFGSSAAALFT